MQLIDRLWYLYVDAFVPYVSSLADEAAVDHDLVSSLTLSSFASLSWKAATFHFNDAHALLLLASYVDAHPQLTSLIVSKLDWLAFARVLADRLGARTLAQSHLSSFVHSQSCLHCFLSSPPLIAHGACAAVAAQAQHKLAGQNLAHLLYLILTLNLVAPTALPADLKVFLLAACCRRAVVVSCVCRTRCLASRAMRTGSWTVRFCLIGATCRPRSSPPCSTAPRRSRPSRVRFFY